MKKYLVKAYSLMLLASAVAFTSCSKDEVVTSENLKQATNGLKHKAKIYEAELTMLNESGVSGTAELTLVGDQLTVKITASGLEPNLPHPQHIHGFTENNANSVCPPESAAGETGYITLADGLPFYGPVLLGLEPFPVADENGDIMYEQTFTVDDSITPLQNRSIVLHGMIVEGSSEFSGLDTDYWATLPVACGQISVKNKGGYINN